MFSVESLEDSGGVMAGEVQQPEAGTATIYKQEAGSSTVYIAKSAKVRIDCQDIYRLHC